MCNPRRIVVRASKRLAEAWQAELTRTAQVTGEVVGEARLVQQLGRSLPLPVRQRLAELIRADPQWRGAGEVLRRDLDNGHIEFRLSTGEVVIVARIATTITAEGSATRTMRGTAEGLGQAEVEASYYDDGYRGRTRTAAEREGTVTAERDAEEQARIDATRSADAARRDAERRLRDAEGDIDAEAHARAMDRLEEQRRDRRAEADDHAAMIARTMQEDILREINVPLAHAYRDILVARASQGDAMNLVVHEGGDIIDIQFELRRH